MGIQSRPHVLLITFPVQGHINPALRFARRLNSLNTDVTFVTTTFVHHRMLKGSAAKSEPGRLDFVTFSDGTDDGYKHGVTDPRRYKAAFQPNSSKALRDVIVRSAQGGNPVTALVYSLVLPWAPEVAREFHLPSALLWIQPALVFDFMYFYFTGYEDEVTKNCDDPDWSIQLPGLPSLRKGDVPSFLVPPGKYSHASLVQTFREHIAILEEETKPMVIVNTFHALEPDALQAIGKVKLVAVGPLVPWPFPDGELYEKSKDPYMDWLDSKTESSVVYVSFGTMVNPGTEQMEEIARGLLETGRPFLWIVKDSKAAEKLTCIEELRRVGMLLPWCSQLEVLSHPSVGCFVTHCGWNSTLESLSCGVPLVAFPQWTDQGTNAKLIQDVWRIGVRVIPAEHGIVSRDEIKRCVELIMDGGERGMELRKNVGQWKDLARDAMRQGGSSDQNLKSLLDDMKND